MVFTYICGYRLKTNAKLAYTSIYNTTLHLKEKICPNPSKSDQELSYDETQGSDLDEISAA
jgi:hypothetical protein